MVNFFRKTGSFRRSVALIDQCSLDIGENLDIVYPMKGRVCIVLVLCVLLSCVAIKERLAIKECTFALISVTPYEFTFNSLKLDFEIKVDNPNDVDAKLDKLVYTLSASETDLLSGTTGRGIKIPSKESRKFVTTVTLEYKELGEALIEAIRLGKVEYKITARAYTTTVFGEISYPVEIVLN